MAPHTTNSLPSKTTNNDQAQRNSLSKTLACQGLSIWAFGDLLGNDRGKAYTKLGANCMHIYISVITTLKPKPKALNDKTKLEEGLVTSVLSQPGHLPYLLVFAITCRYEKTNVA